MKTLMNVMLRERIFRVKPRPRRSTVRSAVGNECNAGIRVALSVLLLTSFAAAQTLTGTVKNSTTGKPAAGDEVVVFSLGQGMKESGRTTTDALGHFSFKLDDAQTPHLLRAIHQNVTYHRVAPPGTTSVTVEVYDAAPKVNGVGVIADIMRIQVLNGQMAVTRDFGVRNTSNPPRTQLNDRNLEFYIPDGAHVVDNSGSAITENGAPLKSAPVPEPEKNRYSFVFPLRPGLTRFEVTYQLPYAGKANLDPKSLYPLEHFMVMLPKSIQFKAAASATGFKLIQFPSAPDATVQVASNTRGGQNLAFDILGEVALETGRHGAQGSGQQVGSSAVGTPAAHSNNRPGGGLGPLIDAPDPLQKYWWWILGGFAAVLILSGVYIASRQQSTARAFSRQKGSSSLLNPMQEEGDNPPAAASILEATRAHGAARPTSLLMDGIKEEFFQIELERKQGQISQSDYQKAKAALDQTLARTLNHKAQKA